MTTATDPNTLHRCPVCGRRIPAVRGIRPLFRHHADKADGICPMSGEPIPEPEVL